MDPAGLEERRRRLEERMRQVKQQPLVAVRLDLLKKLIDDLNTNQELKDTLGEPVTEHLALVWDKANDDILISDANVESMDDVAKIKFLKQLSEAINESLK